MQRLEQIVAAHAQRLGGAVKVEPVAALVLNLGDQDGLALEARCARDPVALGQHADDFAVCVLADLPHERLAIALGHPVLRFDLAIGFDARIEPGQQFGILGRHLLGHGLQSGAVRYVERLRIHNVLAPVKGEACLADFPPGR